MLFRSYKELLEKEKEKQEDDIVIKGKGRETKKTSKLELERNEEHTVDTVNELGRFLEDALKEIEEKEKEKKFGLDNEEVRTWAENVEEENAFEEKIPEENFEKDDENVINTTEILSSSAESSSESDKESEIFEIPEEFELYFGNQDLNLENLFEENLEENFEMALEYGIKLRTFEGRIDENVEDWIIEFEGIADFNNWVDADAVDSARFKAAIAHLRGDALDFYREKRQGNDALRWNTGVVVNSVHNFFHYYFYYYSYMFHYMPYYYFQFLDYLDNLDVYVLFLHNYNIQYYHSYFYYNYHFFCNYFSLDSIIVFLIP